MNIVYFDALNDPSAGASLQTQIRRFIVSQAIMLALAGVPGIYFHSLFGSRNDRDAALRTGINRRINRQKLKREDLESDLAHADSLRGRIFSRFRVLLQVRRCHPAFSPHASQEVLDLGKSIFAVLRTAKSDGSRVLCLHNLADEPASLDISPLDHTPTGHWTDLLSGQSYTSSSQGKFGLVLDPYQVVWISQEQ